MHFDQLIVLLPCHGLEDFDLQRKEGDAEELLSAWSVLWHPRLLAGAKSLPRWLPASSPPADPVNVLVIVPGCCEDLLPDEWPADAEVAGACVLRNLKNRGEMLAAAFERLDPDQSNVDPDLAADFLALGFCHLQVELMTQKLNYMSNLDEDGLKTAAIAAADEAIRGDADEARRHLQTAFDRLHDARDYSNPTETTLIDLTLVASSTCGESLRTELTSKAPINLLISAEVVETMAQREPATLESLSTALADGRAAIIGGEYGEIPLPMLDPDAIERHLRRGLEVYKQHFGKRPIVFGRRHFGLTPALPQALCRTGFKGAMHFTLDDGRFPTGNQSRIEWEGTDGSKIEAIGCVPVDAGRAETFLRLTEHLSEVMNHDQASTMVFAHWPGRASIWYDDLRRAASYGDLLGTFRTVTDHFEQTSYCSQSVKYKADEYRSPYLAQDVSAGRADPISRWVRYFNRRAELQSLAALRTLTAVLQSKSEMEVESFSCEIEDSLNGDAQASSALDKKITAELQTAAENFGRAITGANSPKETGCLIVNPRGFSQQSFEPGFAVDVPSIGFYWTPAGAQPPAPPAERKSWFGQSKPVEQPPLADENALRNEFFEVQFDRTTGAIRTIADYHSRGPRLGQQIALRLPHGGNPEAEQNYTIMAADEIKPSQIGQSMGEMFVRGRLMDRDGRRAAAFTQTTRVWRGSRVIDVSIELDIERHPSGSPWDSYYAARFAWKDETAVLHRDANMASAPTELMQIESPRFLDICSGKRHTTLLVGGLPYHRRLGLRKLDTLLVVQGETARAFHFGIGIDVPHPLFAAMGFIAPPLVLRDRPSPPSKSGWLFHIDCRNVLATDWAPIFDEAEARKLSGFRVGLLETDGVGVRFGFRCFRTPSSAAMIDLEDESSTELAVDGDRVEMEIGPHRRIEVEIQL